MDRDDPPRSRPRRRRSNGDAMMARPVGVAAEPLGRARSLVITTPTDRRTLRSMGDRPRSPDYVSGAASP
jgi:hypothetical protein